MASSLKATPAPQAQQSFFSQNLDIIVLLILMGILFFYRLGSYPLFDLDEPRYAEAAREMLENGNWVTPYFNYELRFDKPVFYYWLVALSYKVFGLSEFSARFSSAVSGAATVLMVYAFGRFWLSRQAGFFAALILATCGLFIGISRMSITDMTLACFITGTILCFFMAVHHHLRWWLAAGAFAGLAVLTKGPVGIVVPGAILMIYAALIGDFKRCLINKWLPLGLLVCLAIAMPWYVLAYQENGFAFIDALLLHNVTRYSDIVSGHKQPIYFYVIVLAAGFLPWTAYLPACLKRLWEHAKNHRTHVQNRNMHYLVPLYATVWTVFIFCFFTVSNTKLLTYILPLFPALALGLAETWQAATRKDGANHIPTDNVPWAWMIRPAWLLVGIGLIGGTIFITQMERLLPREAAGIEGDGYNIAVVLILLAGFIMTAWNLHRHKAAQALVAQAITMTLVVIVGMHGIIPNFNNAAQGVMMDYLAKVGKAPLVLYEIQKTSLTFYAQRRIPRYVEEEPQELVAELNKNEKTYIITKNNHVKPFNRLMPSTLHVQILEKGPVYSLLSVSRAL